MISLLAEMVANGCDAAVMEVSSHAMDQGRVAGLDFDAAVFTNLTGDHLDYHGTMDAYAAAKAKLFESLRPCAKAIVNADDPAGRRMLRDTTARKLTFGVSESADCRIALHRATARSIDCTYTGPWGAIDVTVPLPGKHNAANLAGALLTMHALGFNVSELAEAVDQCPPVPGRLEPVPGSADFDVLVDYAHTDDALANVLTALRPMTKNRLRVVFGCGGDRDKTKRPRMAKIACELADDVVFTSDNPRTESPEQIIDDIVAGVPESKRESVVVEPDRGAAIRLVINAAGPGDVVLIAGKGHEDYQILGAVKHHFDDREQAAAALADRFARVV
jgi:UDP-N-acetylmuramoyl-L-alanyl-D-glutamate--2,6-diaminopimelate ligase